MTKIAPLDLNLADFYLDTESDPLTVASDFTAWRRSVPEYHGLMERRLARGVAPNTELVACGKTYPVINMISLDYLGICQEQAVVQAQIEALRKWGNGAAGVPLLGGMTLEHEALEQELSDMTGQGGTILFSSGFAAATGLGSGLLRRGDLAVLDEQTHMSWVNGIRMAGAEMVTFLHNDPSALDEVLTKHKGRRRLIIVDGLYSMDGDFVDLSALLDVADAHKVGLVVDEAHSVYADGPTGGGLTERLGEQSRVRVYMGAFSKALSMLGGFLSADADLIDYLRYFSHPYLFSCAMPPALVAGIAKATQIIRSDNTRRDRLVENAVYFREGIKTLGLDTGRSESWVVPIILGSERNILFESVKTLMEHGLYVGPVDYPAVPEDAVRIRIAVSAAHKRDDLDRALCLIEDFVAKPYKARGQA